MAWKQPETRDAVLFYFRLVIGGALAAVAVYLVLAGRIDLREVVAVITALMSLDRIGHAIGSRSSPPDNG